MILKGPMTQSTNYSELFSILPANENPQHSSIEGVSCIIHEDHRWLLPIAHRAQQLGELPKPCTLVMFDAHMDSIEPDCTELLRAARTVLQEVVANVNPYQRVERSSMHLAIHPNALSRTQFGTQHGGRKCICMPVILVIARCVGFGPRFNADSRIGRMRLPIFWRHASPLAS